MKINEIITEGPPKGSPFYSAEPRTNKTIHGKEFTPKQYATDKANKIRMKAFSQGGQQAKMPKLSDIKIRPNNPRLKLTKIDPKLSKPLLTRGAGGGPRDWRAEDGPKGKGPRAKLTPRSQELLRNQDIKMGRSKGVRSLGGKFGGTLGVLPALGGTIAARKRAKEYTGKEDPSFMDTMKMMYPVLGKPKKKFGLNPGDA
jgi:hypothetical protein